MIQETSYRKKMEKVQIGVIGIGNMGKNHLRIISEEHSSFDLIGIYDKDMNQAELLAERYGTRSYSHIEDLLEGVDAAIVAVPSSLHLSVGKVVAEHNVNALIEKPLALTADDAELLKNCFEQHDLKLMVGHVERFNPVITELEKMLKNEKIISIEARRYSAFDGRITDASVVEDVMIHDIELICHLMKPYRSVDVFGLGEKVKTDQLDFASCMIEFDSGSHALISASRVSQGKERILAIHMIDGYIEADLLSRTLTISRNTNITIDGIQNNKYKQDSVIQKIFVPIMEPLRAELRTFHHLLCGGAENHVTGEDALEAIKICERLTSITRKEK